MPRFNVIMLLMIFAAAIVPAQTGRYRSGIFLHHSTGGCIWGPNGSATGVPQEIAAYNTLHAYADSLAVSLDETGWPVDPWDNEWYRWHRIFDNEDAQADILPYLATNRIIIIKSCFPSSSVWSDGSPSDTLNPTDKTIYNYKWHWRNIVSVMRTHPENFFVIWTNAPLVADATNDDEARRSDQFCRWAKDTLAAGNDPLTGPFPENVYVFDFFHKLVDAAGKLRPEYASSSGDSHPNAAATALVAPLFVTEVFTAAIAYEEEDVTAPPAPALIAPPDGAINQVYAPQLCWHRAPGAASYLFQLSDDSSFSALLFSDSTLTDTLIVPGSLAESTDFYWRVCARNTAGYGSWSVTWSFTTAPGFVNAIQVRARWNLLSLPGRSADPQVSGVFPTATSVAYRYTEQGEYVQSDSILPGEGYWLKFGYDQLVSPPIEPVAEETVHVVAGWNIIGSISLSLPVESITSDPGGVTTSQFYGYDGGYSVSDSIVPGRAYWVKVEAPCDLVLGQITRRETGSDRIRILPGAGMHRGGYAMPAPGQ
jgi:hypothetical protein